MKRILVLALALCLTLAVCAPSMAESAEGTVFNIYA